MPSIWLSPHNISASSRFSSNTHQKFNHFIIAPIEIIYWLVKSVQVAETMEKLMWVIIVII